MSDIAPVSASTATEIMGVHQWTQAQRDLVKRTVAKGATDDELDMFLHLASRYNLDPFAKEIWFIKRPKKQKDSHGNWDYKRLPNGEIDYTGAETVIMTSRDGYLKAAMSDPNYDGIQSFPVREGDVFKIDAQNFTVEHQISTKNRGKLIGAWAAAYHKTRKPIICYVEFDEYNDPKSNTWQNYPSAMIQKVAEVFVLRRQFSVSGMVSREELTLREVEDAPISTDLPSVPRVGPQRVEQVKPTETKAEPVDPVEPGQAEEEPIDPSEPEGHPATMQDYTKFWLAVREMGLKKEQVYQVAGTTDLKGWTREHLQSLIEACRVTYLTQD